MTRAEKIVLLRQQVAQQTNALIVASHGHAASPTNSSLAALCEAADSYAAARRLLEAVLAGKRI